MTPIEKAKQDLRTEMMVLRNDMQRQINAMVEQIKALEQHGQPQGESASDSPA